MAESSAYSQFVTEIQYAGQCQTVTFTRCWELMKRDAMRAGH